MRRGTTTSSPLARMRLTRSCVSPVGAAAAAAAAATTTKSDETTGEITQVEGNPTYDSSVAL